MTHHNRLASLFEEMGLPMKRGCNMRGPRDFDRRYIYDEINGQQVRECLTLGGGVEGESSLIEFVFNGNGEYVDHTIFIDE